MFSWRNEKNYAFFSDEKKKKGQELCMKHLTVQFMCFRYFPGVREYKEVLCLSSEVSEWCLHS